MAEKRMFAKAVIDSDAFLDMPLTAQALYFHAAMRADDDGFVANPKKIQRMIGASDDDLKLLIAKEFIFPFQSGIIAIRHWRVHNWIRADRRKPTIHQEEMSLLSIETNQTYSLGMPDDSQVTYQVTPQNRLDKISIDKNRIEIEKSTTDETPKKEKKPSPKRHQYGEYQNVLLTHEELDKLQREFPYDWQGRVERLSEYMASTGKSYQSHLATIRAWARKEQKSTPASVGDRKWCTMNDPSPEEILGITEDEAHA